MIGQNQARDKFFLKITIWGRVLLFFLFYLVNLDLVKFGPHPMGVEVVYPSMWDPDKPQKIEKIHFT